MQKVKIDDPYENTFPFGRDFFEDRTIVFHGTWSTYSAGIESDGLLSGYKAFDLTPFDVITKALDLVGVGSFYSAFDDKMLRPFSVREVFFSPNFWEARAYATDGGGEVLRKTIEDADKFTRICSDNNARESLLNRWNEGLKSNPHHSPTRAAIAVLEDAARLQLLNVGVMRARQQLIDRGEGGHPVVYAVRVEPDWFGEAWERYLVQWRTLGVAGGELKCHGVAIPPSRLVG